MREIRFRTWDRDARQMYYDVGLREDGTPFKQMPRRYYELESDKDLTGEIVLTQFTGLKDKNEKEIYEGDIVRAMIDKSASSDMGTIGGVEPEIIEVKIEAGWGCNVAMLILDPVCEAETEIIGNIYENPELLKDSQ